jgi:K+:H+ antiporter
VSEVTTPSERIRYEFIDAGACQHLDTIDAVSQSAACEDCLQIGSSWVHLRICLTCGHVGCCDDSPNRHAWAHHARSGHPLIRSIEEGETWGWCFEDRILLRPRP